MTGDLYSRRHKFRVSLKRIATSGGKGVYQISRATTGESLYKFKASSMTQAYVMLRRFCGLPYDKELL